MHEARWYTEHSLSQLMCQLCAGEYCQLFGVVTCWSALCVCVCVYLRVRAYVRACVRARERVCVCVCARALSLIAYFESFVSTLHRCL